VKGLIFLINAYNLHATINHDVNSFPNVTIIINELETVDF